MEWIEATISINYTNSDQIEGILINNGLTGYIINDPNEFTAFVENENREWDYIDDGLLDMKKSDHSITFYVTKTINGNEQLNSILSQIKSLDSTISMTTKNVNDADWENEWKKYYKPFEIGDRIVVKPTWEHYENVHNKIVIEMDPGLAFGTGTHESTRLAMELIYALADCHMENALDFGCGSGILGITLHKMGVKHINLVDIDYNAENIVKNNFALNNICDSSYNIYVGNTLNDIDLFKKITAISYDFIAINIVADIIIMHMDFIYDILKDGGIVVSSGIINERANDVFNAFKKKGFSDIKAKSLNSWTSISARR